MMDLLGEFDLVDPFRLLDGRKRESTWQGRVLNRFCKPGWMTSSVVSMSHHAGYSDHKLKMIELCLDNIERLPEQVWFNSGLWKLNSQVL